MVLKFLEIFTLPIIVMVFTVMYILVLTSQNKEVKSVEKVNKN